MTTIAALSHAGRVHMGGDSCVTVADVALYRQRLPKVFQVGPAVIGICGNAPWEEALRNLKVPRAPGTDIPAWVRDEFCVALQRELGDNGDRPEDEALLGVGGRIWFLEVPGTAWEIGESWAAVGSGADVARGLLRYTGRRAVRAALKLTPRDRLTAALDAAEALTAGTRRPFKYATEKT